MRDFSVTLCISLEGDYVITFSVNKQTLILKISCKVV